MKENKELIKTVIITILITANASFLAGVYYSNRLNAHVKTEVQTQVSSLKVELPETKK